MNRIKRTLDEKAEDKEYRGKHFSGRNRAEFVERNRDRILDSIEANYRDGDLLYWEAPTGTRVRREIILLNMLELDDPEDHRQLCHHTGHHATIQTNIRRARNTPQILLPLATIDFTKDEPYLIIPMCRHGIHRSTGMALSLIHI